MNESWPYRSDLAVFASSFAARSKRQIWRDDSLSKAEKMLFVGFFFIRKLIECQRVTDQCAKSSVAVLRGPVIRAREVSAFRRDDLMKDVSRVQWAEGKVDAHQLADKIIHTWWVIPTSDESSGLAGFIFTTDKQKNKELWLLPTRSIVEAFERFSSSEIREIHSKRDKQGRLTHWEAK